MTEERLEEILKYKNDCPCTECQNIRAMAQEIRRCWAAFDRIQLNLLNPVVIEDIIREVRGKSHE